MYYNHKILYAIDKLFGQIQVIHEAGIIHSDLKPANFLVVAGTLKLIDFGIASSVQSDKTSVIKDTQMGTFNFMSPETIEDLNGDDEYDDEPEVTVSKTVFCERYQVTSLIHFQG